MAWSSVAAWPDGLCFVNELWGGMAGGYRLVSDSNYDWGQGLKELAAWQRQHRVANLMVLYYGTDTALSRLPMCRVCGSPPSRLAGATTHGALHGCTLAVSTTILFGSCSDWPAVRDWVTFLRPLPPADRTPTFLIYRFGETDSDPGPTMALRDRP